MTTRFMRQLQFSFLGIILFGIFVVVVTEKTESQNQAIEFNIDTLHSSVLFRAKHMGVTYFYGRFNEFEGNITFNEDDVSESNVEFEVKSASVDTANDKRDQHLRSSDFFSAKQFPVISFKSTKVSNKPDKENIFEVTGDFNMHGVKKQITIDVELTGKKNVPDSGSIIGLHTTFDILRSDYGINFGLEGINDEIRITVSVEAAQK